MPRSADVLSKIFVGTAFKVLRSIGGAFQSAALLKSLTVEDNVALPLGEHTRHALRSLPLWSE